MILGSIAGASLGLISGSSVGSIVGSIVGLIGGSFLGLIANTPQGGPESFPWVPRTPRDPYPLGVPPSGILTAPLGTPAEAWEPPLIALFC